MNVKIRQRRKFTGYVANISEKSRRWPGCRHDATSCSVFSARGAPVKYSRIKQRLPATSTGTSWMNGDVGQHSRVEWGGALRGQSITGRELTREGRTRCDETRLTKTRTSLESSSGLELLRVDVEAKKFSTGTGTNRWILGCDSDRRYGSMENLKDVDRWIFYIWPLLHNNLLLFVISLRLKRTYGTNSFIPWQLSINRVLT